jgi:2-polyprenyl-6-methoxyphenol hydroxylase-like FAD-dependent oxidoreductase
MAPKSEFKVVIAGGGVAGLTLAIMLERFGIDYVLLEAHAEIAPAIGASIGLLANGLRILDQLGCYEAIEKAASQRICVSRSRDSKGNPVFSLHDSHGKLIRR